MPSTSYCPLRVTRTTARRSDFVKLNAYAPPMADIPTIELADGTHIPSIGQGTWFIGDEPSRREAEIATLRTGVELGLRVIDTAEMYGDGRSEQLVGEAITPIRDEVFLVDKVLPSNASRGGTVRACERSLERLGTDWIDLYLLHWPGPHPLDETAQAFESLKARGLIGAWGVSNFDTDELRLLPGTPAANQVLYNPARRGIEFDLMPQQAAMGIPVMAYSPIEQGVLLQDATLAQIAAESDATVAQVLIAWAVRSGRVIALPKASRVEHVRQNAQAAELVLDEDQLQRIDSAFPPPETRTPLEVI